METVLNRMTRAMMHVGRVPTWLPKDGARLTALVRSAKIAHNDAKAPGAP
jgi:hypothetical protein